MSRAKPQSLEGLNAKLGQSTPIQSEMTIHVFFLEVGDLPSSMEEAEPTCEMR